MAAVTARMSFESETITGSMVTVGVTTGAGCSVGGFGGDRGGNGLHDFGMELLTQGGGGRSYLSLAARGARRESNRSDLMGKEVATAA